MIGSLTSDMIDEILQSHVFGRIGCCYANKTYIVPINYVYDGKSIIAHSVEGMKIDMMRKNPHVCFQVDEIVSFTNWKSVIAWGEFFEIKDEMERYRAMKLFVDHTLRMKISESALPPELHFARVHPRTPGNIRPIIYRIILSEKTGRFENE